MSRYTSKALQHDIDSYNRHFEARGWLCRFVMGGRNGYTAVDVYTVDVNGKRIGSGVDNNVGCGSPRECREYCNQFELGIFQYTDSPYRPTTKETI